jgi:hypothetical protein
MSDPPDVLAELSGHAALTRLAAQLAAPWERIAQLTAPLTAEQLATFRARMPWLDWEQSPTSALLVPQQRRRGRPAAFNPDDDASFAARLIEVSHRAAKEGERLTYASLERHGFEVGWRTIRDGLNRHGYDLAAIETDAERCAAFGRNFCRFNVRDRARFKKTGHKL